MEDRKILELLACYGIVAYNLVDIEAQLYYGQ